MVAVPFSLPFPYYLKAPCDPCIIRPHQGPRLSEDTEKHSEPSLPDSNVISVFLASFSFFPPPPPEKSLTIMGSCPEISALLSSCSFLGHHPFFIFFILISSGCLCLPWTSPTVFSISSRTPHMHGSLFCSKLRSCHIDCSQQLRFTAPIASQSLSSLRPLP